MSDPNALIDGFGWKKTPFIEQSEASECGLACLTMVANYHGYKTDILAMRRRYGMSLKGTDLSYLIEVAEAMGFNGQPLRGDIDDLESLNLPAILHWDMNHFVVLTRVTKTLGGVRYSISDPATGEIKLTRDELSRHWTGIALDLMKSESFKPKVADTRLRITQLWTSMDGFWKTFSGILALSLILQAIALAGPFYLQVAVDTVFPSFDLDLLFVLALGFGGLTAINFVATWLRSIILVHLNSALSYQIIVNLFRHLVRLPLPWFEKRHVGDIISRFGSTQPITQLLSEGMLTALIDGLLAFVTLGLMYIYSPMLANVALVALLLFVAIKFAFLQAIRMRNVDVITTAAKENTSFIETMRGISAIKAFGQEGNRQRLWQRTKTDAINAEIKLGRLTASFDAIGQFIAAAEKIIFVYLAISLAFEGAFTIGMIFAFQAYKQQFLDASMRLVEQAVNFKILQVHLTRISDIALAKREVQDDSDIIEAPDFTKSIVLENVTYRYGTNDPTVLERLNLSVTPGEFIAISGPSGGGKTTLMKVVMGLFQPTYGAMRLGQQNLTSLSLTKYRRQIGSVAQDDVLYAGSIAENIAFFDHNIDMDRVREVSKLAHIHYDIEKMPLAYESLVGDMGSVFSGGQQQRVLLARALYSNPSVLIMDEGTANLDPDNEKLILDTISKLKMTRILIAHRQRTLDIADRHLILAGGHLFEVPRNEKHASGISSDLASTTKGAK
ncbi:MAG: peptidase domain-containing ABC transporter [Pseudomonadota bacterium]